MSSDSNRSEDILRAGGLLGKKQKGKYKLTIFPAKAGEIGAIPVAELLKTNMAQQPSLNFRSPVDGQEWDFPIPDGDLKTYIEKRAKEFGEPDAHIVIRYDYEPAPDEEPVRIPVDKLPKHVKDALKKQG
jgi:hypothetical protein